MMGQAWQWLSHRRADGRDTRNWRPARQTPRRSPSIRLSWRLASLRLRSHSPGGIASAFMTILSASDESYLL
jgi:hypothetical protein